MVHSPDGDTSTTARILQGGTLASYLLILCLNYVLWISIDQIKENGFSLKKRQEAVNIL